MQPNQDKSINTLVQDIYGVMTGKHQVSEEASKKLGEQIGKIITDRLSKGNREPQLSLSVFGTKCDKKLWYMINEPDKAEPLDPWVRIKLLYGDILEELVLFLAEQSGHRVVGRQDEVSLHGVPGHRDAIIDGALVDVKSANARSFDKFKNHTLEQEDSFGYLDQVSGYLEASLNDPELKVKGEFAFLAIDKELGHIVVDKYKATKRDWLKEVQSKRFMLSQKNPPARAFQPKPEGKSGNMAIPFQCAYCDFKNHCYRDANQGYGLRKFIYSSGPKWFTNIVREPDVKEEKP